MELALEMLNFDGANCLIGVFIFKGDFFLKSSLVMVFCLRLIGKWLGEFECGLGLAFSLRKLTSNNKSSVYCARLSFRFAPTEENFFSDNCI